MGDRDDYRTAWAMFKAQELDDIELADEIWKGYEGTDVGLVRGMTLVAAVLRKHLLDHAREVGCDCGSDDWLQAAILRAHLRDDGEGSDE